MQVFKLVLLLLLISLLYSCNDSTIKTRSSDRGGGTVDITDSNGSKILSYSGSYALIIGQSDYTAGWQDLNSIPSELDNVQAVLEDQGFFVERHENVNSSKLKLTVEKFINNYGTREENLNNRLLFFYAGHGESRLNGTRGYIVPVDAPNPNVDEKGFLDKAVAMNQVMTWARNIESKHALFLFDSCFSGTLFKLRNIPKIPRQISQAMAEPVRQFITAGSANQAVPAKSTFTPAFVNALRYAYADTNKDGYITGMELGIYLWNKVPKHIRQTPQYGKIRDIDFSEGDFVFKVGAKNKQKRIEKKPKRIVIDSETSKIDSETYRKLRCRWAPEEQHCPIPRIAKQLGTDEEVAKRFFEHVSNFIRDIQKNLTNIASHRTTPEYKNILINNTIQKYFRHPMKSKVQTSSIITSKIRTDSVKTYLRRLSNLSMKYKTVELYFDTDFDIDIADIDEFYENGTKIFIFNIPNIWQRFKVCHINNKTCNQNYTKTKFDFNFYYKPNLGDLDLKVNAITVDQVATSYTGKANWNIKDVSN
jgi:hypothetical protein